MEDLSSELLGIMFMVAGTMAVLNDRTDVGEVDDKCRTLLYSPVHDRMLLLPIIVVELYYQFSAEKMI